MPLVRIANTPRLYSCVSLCRRQDKLYETCLTCFNHSRAENSMRRHAIIMTKILLNITGRTRKDPERVQGLLWSQLVIKMSDNCSSCPHDFVASSRNLPHEFSTLWTPKCDETNTGPVEPKTGTKQKQITKRNSARPRPVRKTIQRYGYNRNSGDLK